MANFYATYSPAAASGATVVATQGTSPWIVAGSGVAGTPAGGVLTVQGDPAGTAIPITGSITATNPSVGATGAAVPASATFIGGTDGTNLRAAHVSAAGLVSVDGSGATQPVSGTVAVSNFPATQPVSGTVAVSNFPATQPVSGTVAATQSGTWNITNVSGTVTLPTGASTAAKQPALGTAGTASADVITVQGIASMTPLLVNGSGSTQPISGTVAATQSGTWNIGTVTTVTGVTTVSTVSAVTAITNALPAGTNLLGKVGIDQTTPGTTNGVVVNTIAPVTTTTAAFQAEGSVAFGSLTTSFATIFTPTAATKILQMRNNMNQPVIVSLDAGTTTNYVLDPGDAISLDLLANALNMGATAIQAKYSGTAPTSGNFRINGCH